MQAPPVIVSPPCLQCLPGDQDGCAVGVYLPPKTCVDCSSECGGGHSAVIYGEYIDPGCKVSVHPFGYNNVNLVIVIAAAWCCPISDLVPRDIVDMFAILNAIIKKMRADGLFPYYFFRGNNGNESRGDALHAHLYVEARKTQDRAHDIFPAHLGQYTHSPEAMKALKEEWKTHLDDWFSD